MILFVRSKMDIKYTWTIRYDLEFAWFLNVVKKGHCIDLIEAAAGRSTDQNHILP